MSGLNKRSNKPKADQKQAGPTAAPSMAPTQFNLPHPLDTPAMDKREAMLRMLAARKKKGSK